MADGTDSSKNAAQVLQDARILPGERTDGEIPTLFSTGEKNPFVGDKVEENALGLKVKVESFVKTFVLWRPWEYCGRCARKIELEEGTLPEEAGDYTCPHVQIESYKKAKDRCLSGEGVVTHEEFFMLKNGTRCVQFVWLEADKAFLEDLERKQNVKDENWVYPPRPDKAFADPVDKAKKRAGKTKPPARSTK